MRTSATPKGYSIDQVVHDYGDLGQAVTELAVAKSASITNAEFRTLNACLDNAIARAVSEYGRLCAQDVAEIGTAAASRSASSVSIRRWRSMPDRQLLHSAIANLCKTPSSSRSPKGSYRCARKVREARPA